MPRISGKLIAAIIVLVIGFVAVFQMGEVLDAKHIMTIQYPNGSIAVFTDPGPHLQMFGTVTKFSRRVTYSFSNSEDCTHRDKNGTTPFKIQFNDGGTAELCGSLQWEMPTRPELVVKLLKDYNTEEAIDQTLVRNALNNAVTISGPTMSSIESVAERKPELLQYIEDQAKNGTYQMTTRNEKLKDPITGVEKTVSVAEIVRDKQGIAQRSSNSAMGDYGVQIVQLTIGEVNYDSVVRGQIKARQDAINQVQIAIANAKRAEQDALTIEKQGQATAAAAKWKQEAFKAQAVTQAEQEKAVAVTQAEKDKEVAELQKQAAEFNKQKLILEGQGEAEKRRLILAADGALSAKLQAYTTSITALADAIKEAKPGAWASTVSMGASGSTSGMPGAQGVALIDLLTAKTARDLGLDMSIKKQQ